MHSLHTLMVAAVIAALSTAVPAAASVVVPMSLGELAREARLIVDAEVIAVHPIVESGRIERMVTLRVAARWKGESDDVVHVRLAGGTYGRTRTVVPGVPDMATGERLVLFLGREPGGAYVVLGLHQGAWRVRDSGADGRAMVGPVLPTGTHGPVVRGAPARRPVSVDDLKRVVRHLAETAP
jgi:hypothetical protein